MPKRMPGRVHAGRGRPKLWIEYAPWWIRHPRQAVQVLEKNALYFERKAAALRAVAKAFMELADRSYEPQRGRPRIT